MAAPTLVSAKLLREPELKEEMIAGMKVDNFLLKWNTSEYNTRVTV